MREDWTVLAIFVTLVALWTADTVMDAGWFPDPLQPAVEVHTPTFADVKPIFENRCLECHSAEHWNWTNYDTAFAKRREIYNRVWGTRSMPMGKSMPESERVTIRDWVDGGAAK